MAAADEGRAVIAFDKTTGEERWRYESRKLELAYGTPQVRDMAGGNKQLVLAVPEEMWGLDLATGKVVTKRKVEGMVGSRKRSFYASLVRVGDRLIATSRTSGVFVFEATPEMKSVAQNRLGDESDFNATPTVATDALYLRSNEAVYCVGQ